jgi:predicted amidohydrolase
VPELNLVEDGARRTVAAVQCSPILGAVSHNVEQAVRRISALRGRADLVVFPELFTTGYNREHLDHAQLAESLDDSPTVSRLTAAAADARVALTGTLLERDGAAIYDTAIVIDSDGRLVGRYRKTHLYPAEQPYFTRGDGLLVVPVGDELKLGLAICFEHAFPEIFTELALLGANLIAIPSAVPDGFGYLLDLRTRARAQDNQLFVVASNLVGFDSQTRWCGRSAIIGPRGEALAVADAEGEAVLIAKLDLDEIGRERRQEPVLASRRPELYQRSRGVVPR